MSALYVITNQYLTLATKLSDGDLDATTIADTIEASGITDALAAKAQGIESVARSFEVYNLTIDAEIERLQALKAQRSRVAAGLRSYLLDNMQRAGIEKIDCPLFSISIRKNTPSVEIIDPLSIPQKYMVVPEPKLAQPDKRAIAMDLKLGADVPGARLTQSVRLNIK